MTKLAKQSEPLKVETWAVEKIVPYARNPRKNEGVPVAKVKASIPNTRIQRSRSAGD